MTTTHTPGPWTYEARVKDADDVRVHGTHTNYTVGYVRECNARLVAAAPEMLRLLRLMVREWEHDTNGRLTAAGTEARALLVKIEGEDSR